MTHVHDLVFRNVRLVDGTGSAPRNADVAVDGDRIAAIGEPSTLKGRSEIDGTGRVLSPGFIDIHSHADFGLLLDGRAHSAVTQGVTTIVPGNCGHGVAPFTGGKGVSQTDMAFGLRPKWTQDLDDFTSFGGYLSQMASRGVGPNVLPMIPHGVLRASVAGFEERELSASELATMVSMADEAMDAGAIGISSGLEYTPGIAATREELAAVAMPVGARGGFYATHCRNRSERIVEAAEEAVYITQASGCRLEMSHFVRRPTGPGRDLAMKAMDVIRKSDAAGTRSRFDVFPLEYGPSPVAMFVPQKFRREAGTAFGERLSDPTFVNRIIGDLDPRFVAMLEQGIAEDMYISDDANTGEYVGWTLGQLAKAKKTNVASAAILLMAEAGPNYYDVVINERWLDWNDLVAAMQDPDFIIMGDGGVANLDGPLAGKGFALADWGYATRALGQFVRDLGALELSDAIRRMTFEPAAQLGLSDRGTVAEGSYADLVLFDLETVGSDVRPEKVTVVSTGIEQVLVNGVFVVRDGDVTNTRPGRVGRHNI
ncbi:N-acyl-D-amino-acid deacylase family protein [Aeromicrobium wangtongii]|uniref:Amidohydrolase family protein n=1 Tax=Aeromicrobium wangtongii TaxID=2969247 RepID=A0ABY5MEU5_9ACTN|nr:amidohydrolase family protein [Aeromicrobium wangtongii]MCD9197785.1 amidohydrolase family protein [Aeromicrobium wangtongii]UUP15267.1 amidohydrolase family protein [Aeromicrobium wangtongii]